MPSRAASARAASARRTRAGLPSRTRQPARRGRARRGSPSRGRLRSRAAPASWRARSPATDQRRGREAASGRPRRRRASPVARRRPAPTISPTMQASAVPRRNPLEERDAVRPRPVAADHDERRGQDERARGRRERVEEDVDGRVRHASGRRSAVPALRRRGGAVELVPPAEQDLVHRGGAEDLRRRARRARRDGG